MNDKLGCVEHRMQANQNPRNLYLNNCQNVFIGDNNDISLQSSSEQGMFTTNQNFF